MNEKKVGLIFAVLMFVIFGSMHVMENIDDYNFRDKILKEKEISVTCTLTDAYYDEDNISSSVLLKCNNDQDVYVKRIQTKTDTLLNEKNDKVFLKYRNESKCITSLTNNKSLNKTVLILEKKDCQKYNNSLYVNN